MKQVRNVCSLQDFESLEVMIRLGEGWVAVAGRGVRVTQWEINSETEENLVINVDVLAHRLVRVQRDDLTLDNGHGTFSRSFDEVTVHFSDSAVSLHSLDIVLAGEVLDNLELFVPVVQLLQVDSVKRHDCLAELFRLTDLNGLLGRFDPTNVSALRLGHKKWLSV
jgi:hypothetical protein